MGSMREMSPLRARPLVSSGCSSDFMTPSAPRGSSTCAGHADQDLTRCQMEELYVPCGPTLQRTLQARVPAPFKFGS